MGKPTQHYSKWRIRWVDEFGKRRSASFDNYSDAEFSLKRKELEVEEIKRGLRQSVMDTKNYQDICEYWVKYRTSKKKNARDDLSIIQAHLSPFFAKTQLKSISIAMVDRFVAQKSHLSPKTVANHLTLLISQLNLAHDLGWLLKVPRIKKPRVRMNSQDYSYLRTQEEIERFLTSARVEGDAVYALYLTAVSTGMRAGELATLTWGDVDFDRRLIIVQRSFNGVTKGEEVRYVPIMDGLLEFLRSWKMKSCGKHVFTNRDGNMLRESGRIFQEVLHRVLKRAGFPEVKRVNRTKRYIRFHDLRHTFASHWMMRSGDKFKLQRILGHKSSEMTERYSHLDPRSFESDYDRMNFSLREFADVLQYPI